MNRRGKEVSPIYPADEWEIIEEKFQVENNLRNETIFSLGNGFLGMRGNFEEGYNGPAGTSVEGTYINGFYDTELFKYPEVAHGYPEKSQTMLNITNGKVIKLYVEDEELQMTRGQLWKYRRSLDLGKGVLRRTFFWRSPAGREISVDITRLVSFTNKHLAAIAYTVVPLNFSGRIRLFSALDGEVQNLQTEKDPRVGAHLKGRVLEVLAQKIDKGGGLLHQRTKNTGLSLACAMRNQALGPLTKVETTAERRMIGASYEFQAVTGEAIQFYKYLAYVTAQDGESDHLDQAEKVVQEAQRVGFDRLCHEQQGYLAVFWQHSDVKVQGDQLVQQGLRFNAFHLLQAVGKDGVTNIGAKGLTGEGYEGHYFWDTEIYIMPFFLHNVPSISKALLKYRYHTLDQARARALEIGLTRGALYPWRTIGGAECSPFFPAGTAQYHINADIAYALKQYVESTGDEEFLRDYGAEILFETARFWMEMGEFNPRKDDRFCINVVTGPDEYTALVNNNCYTNMMAREHLNFAGWTADWLRETAAERYRELCAKISLDENEVRHWQQAAAQMYIPYDEQLQLHAQDDTFFDKPRWDLAATPSDHFPLLLHYHPLLIYRAQVCKQPDVVLALFLLGKEFSLEQKIRNYDYYERITTHDSSLSPSIFSIVAAEIGYVEKAYSYFRATVRLDLDDYLGNTKDGIHAACMAGSWLCVVYGFAGMRVDDGILRFAPTLPEQWQEYSFHISYKGRVLRVTVDKTGTTYLLVEGDPLTILHHQEEIRLKTEKFTNMLTN
jgi:alpha,alpha-trehalose phosphorylase